VGFIGYPNVGKSSIINTLKKKKVCKSAPVPGETKVWQYVTLFKRIFLIDCPGVVYPGSDTDENLVLKGVVRIETLNEPAAFVADVLRRVKPEYITRHFGVPAWTSALDFLEKVAVKSGKMLKGAEPDVSTAGRMVLNDFLRGRLPYFELPLQTPEQKTALQARKQQLHVEQIFSKIAVRTSFNEDDMKAPAGFEDERKDPAGFKEPAVHIAPTMSEDEVDDEGDSEERGGEQEQAFVEGNITEKRKMLEEEDSDEDLGPAPAIVLEEARALEQIRRASKAEVRAADWDALFAATKRHGGKRTRSS